jgi:hypothetical protein
MKRKDNEEGVNSFAEAENILTGFAFKHTCPNIPL